MACKIKLRIKSKHLFVPYSKHIFAYFVWHDYYTPSITTFGHETIWTVHKPLLCSTYTCIFKYSFCMQLVENRHYRFFKFVWMHILNSQKEDVSVVGCYTCVTHVVIPLWPSLPASVLPKSCSSCETGIHRFKHFGRNNKVNVVRNWRLIEQYSIKFMAEFINARISIKSPVNEKKNIDLSYMFSIFWAVCNALLSVISKIARYSCNKYNKYNINYIAVLNYVPKNRSLISIKFNIFLINHHDYF